MKGDMHMMWKWTKTIPTHNCEISHDDADKSTLLISRPYVTNRLGLPQKTMFKNTSPEQLTNSENKFFFVLFILNRPVSLLFEVSCEL